MKDPRQAYYILNHRSLQPNTLRSAFDYDGTHAAKEDRRAQLEMINTSAETAQKITRPFVEQKSGVLTFDFSYRVSGDKDGYAVSFDTPDDERVFTMEAKDGKLLCCGFPAADSSEGHHTVIARIDLDARTASLLYDAKDCGAFPLYGKDEPVDRLVFETIKGHLVTFCPTFFDLHTGYLVNERFDLAPFGALPEDWTVCGDMTVGGAEKRNKNVFIDAKAGQTYTAVKTFTSESGRTVFEAKLLLPEGSDGASVSLLSDGDAVLTLYTENGAFYSTDGVRRMNFTKNVWQWLRIDADPKAGTAHIRIDTKDAGYADIPKGIAFDGIRIAFAPKEDAVLWWNEVNVYPYEEPDDYCPEPKPVDTGKYIVGMNVCNLWTEGRHFGWDAISPFPDVEPVLGYYDEGIPEVADWEIKFMVEHGISFEHPCWYCPIWDIHEPIMGGNEAMTHGLLVAKYEKYMKFTFMWENTSGQVKNFEQFRDYIWPYWKEYFFSNKQFLSVDGKAVLTCYSYSLFISGFGGMEKAKAALEYMREDIKTLGYTGLIFLFHDCHERTMKIFQPMIDVGADGVYGYHWNNLGKWPKHQQKRMETDRNFGLYVMPTVAVGFNSIGWHGHRDDLITLPDHEIAARYVKDEFLPAYDEEWKKYLLVCATWNEYGEGHYMMPSGLHGFGFLDTIRRVYSDAPDDHEEDLLPNEHQKARLCRLYPQNRTIIKPLEMIDESKKHIPTKVLAKWDFADPSVGARFKPSDDILEYDTAHGTLHGRREGGTGDILVTCADTLHIPMEDIACIHIRMRSVDENNYCEISYTLENEERGGSLPMSKIEYHASEDYTDYYIPRGMFTKTDGVMSGIALSPMRLGWGTFDVALLEILGYEEDDKPASVSVNGRTLVFDYEPEVRGDDIYCTFNPAKRAFDAFGLVYNYDRKAGVLRVKSADKDMRFKAGYDTFLVNGRARNLPSPFEVKDGLPVLPVKYLASLLGYESEWDGKNLCVKV